MQFREKLAKHGLNAGLLLPEAAYQALETYFDLLRQWNRRVSLTALTVEQPATDEAIDRLLIEPAVAARHLPSDTAKVIDVGSGGGSPAIPLKIVAPAISMLMVESKMRKAAFLREVSRQLALVNTEVAPVRFEELLHRRELYDTTDVISLRAVKVDTRFFAAAEVLLKPGGLLFWFTTALGIHRDSTSPLLPEGNHALVPHLGSRLQLLRKVG